MRALTETDRTSVPKLHKVGPLIASHWWEYCNSHLVKMSVTLIQFFPLARFSTDRFMSGPPLILGGRLMNLTSPVREKTLEWLPHVFGSELYSQTSHLVCLFCSYPNCHTSYSCYLNLTFWIEKALKII